MWSRLDWKNRGTFNVNFETTLIHRGLRGWQRHIGDFVTWWRFDPDQSMSSDVYDEAVGWGKNFYGPWKVPVIHATHGEGPNTEPRESGLYLVDQLQITAEFDQLNKIGITQQDVRTGSYQRDRIAYDDKLFAVREMRILGQIRRRDIIVSVSATQIKNDELVNDPMFVAYRTNIPPDYPDPLLGPGQTKFGESDYGDDIYGG